MKITPTEQRGLKYGFNIVVGASEIEKQIEHELNAIGSRAKIPGFRPGKVPLTILKQKYGKSVLGDVLQDAVNKAAQELMKKENLKPALRPDIKIVDYSEGGDLEFNLNLEVLPDVPELEFEKISIEKLVVAIDEAEVQKGLERLAQRYKNYEDAPEGTKAKNGDVVRMDFVGKTGGVAFEGGTASDFRLELGSGQLIPGFEDQLEGLKAGDKKVVKVTFPDDYHSKSLAGQKAEFDVTIKAVMTAAMPELNAEFSKKLGFPDVEKIREAIRESLLADYDALARARAKKDLFDYLDEKVAFDVPEGMLKLEFDSIWEKLVEAKNAGDTTLDKPEDELREEYQAIAERRVRLGIILSETARREKVQVTREELSRAVMDQARMFPGKEQKVLEFYKKNPGQVEELRGPILEEKTVDWILAKAKRPERKVSVEELVAANNEGNEGHAKPVKKAAKKAKEGDAKASKSTKTKK